MSQLLLYDIIFRQNVSVHFLLENETDALKEETVGFLFFFHVNW